MHSACAELIADCIATQRVVGTRLHDHLSRSEVAAPVMDGSVREIIADARRVQRIAAKLRERIVNERSCCRTSSQERRPGVA
jgi:hypothetical protein